MDTSWITELVQAAPFKPNDIISQAATLGIYGSVVSFITGMVYMVSGWRIFKIMVVIIFGFGGFYLGQNIGDIFGYGIIGGFTAGILLAIVSLPLIKYATSLILAVLTAMIAGYAWQQSALPQQYTIICAVAGLIIGALCGYYIFRLAVTAYTSLLGATMIIVGFCGFIASTAQDSEQQAILPHNAIVFLLALLTLTGILLQYRLYEKTEKDTDKK